MIQVRKALKKEAEMLSDRLLQFVSEQNNEVPWQQNLNFVQGGALEDLNDCNALAHVHESLEWIAYRMSKMLNKLAPVLETEEMEIIETITNLRNGFQSLSETCLLVLHLDVRVRCFTKLVPMMCNNNYGSGFVNLMEAFHSELKRKSI